MKRYLENIKHGTKDFHFEDYTTEWFGNRHLITPLHWHPEMEVIYVYEGTLILQIEQTEYQLSEGEILFISPGELHAVTAIKSPSRYHAYVFGENLFKFNETHFLNSELIVPLFCGDLVPKRTVKPEDVNYAVIAEKLSAIHTAPQNCAHYKAQITLLLLSVLISMLEVGQYKKNCAKDFAQSDSEIRRCIHYMEYNLSHHITLKELADTIHMTPSYFCIFFKRHTGYTPFEQLTLIRLHKAEELLQYSDLTVAEISMQCGFGSITFFNRKFKEIVGITPREYRRKWH